jgi:hypothetical protein
VFRDRPLLYEETLQAYSGRHRMTQTSPKALEICWLQAPTGIFTRDRDLCGSRSQAPHRAGKLPPDRHHGVSVIAYASLKFVQLIVTAIEPPLTVTRRLDTTVGALTNAFVEGIRSTRTFTEPLVTR